MTAREFLEWAGYDVTEETLLALTVYVAGDIDYSQFPDADVPISEYAEEPALFQEWMDLRYYNN